MTINPSPNTALPVKLGQIAFINALPIYHAYQPGPNVLLCPAVPSSLNQQMLCGELHISPVSSACYLQNRKQLLLLPDLSISADSAVESVLFFSKEPWEGLCPPKETPARIAVTNESETSVMLLRILLKHHCGHDLTPYFQPYPAADYEQALAQNGNALIIGDKALRFKQKWQSEQLPYHCYDLAAAWRQMTGLPFVFAVWVANRQWAKASAFQAQAESIDAIQEGLTAARDRFFESSALFEQGLEAAQRISGLPKESIFRYYTQCLRFDFDASLQAGLNRFNEEIQCISTTSSE